MVTFTSSSMPGRLNSVSYGHEMDEYFCACCLTNSLFWFVVGVGVIDLIVVIMVSFVVISGCLT